MANLGQLEIIQAGVVHWNKWREENPQQLVDLSGAKLCYENLREANFIGADLSKADLRGADLIFANISMANLSETIFEGAQLGDAKLDRVSMNGGYFEAANLEWASLHRAHIYAANFRGASLCNANLLLTVFSHSDFHRANFANARLFETMFADTKLKETLGLDSCIHDAPSVLDYRTLAQSGRLPPAFLRGCGLPEALITYLPSLLNQPIQFYSCFISYSTRDQEFADRLHADLQNKGVRCWFAPHDIQGGKKIHEQIDEAIRVYDRLLLVLSEASMRSEWVKTEIAHARQKEIQEKRQVLFPLSLVTYTSFQQWNCFDADTGKDSAREIREYFIPDFSHWKAHDEYQMAFDRLVRDLKTEGQTPGSRQDRLPTV